MYLVPILAAAVVPSSDLSLDSNDLLDTVLPILAIVGPGLLVLAIMVFITLRKNIPK